MRGFILPHFVGHRKHTVLKYLPGYLSRIYIYAKQNRWLTPSNWRKSASRNRNGIFETWRRFGPADASVAATDMLAVFWEAVAVAEAGEVAACKAEVSSADRLRSVGTGVIAPATPLGVVTFATSV